MSALLISLLLTATPTPASLSPRVFTGLWLLEESSTARTSHPTLGGGIAWQPFQAWEGSAELRLTYDLQGTQTVFSTRYLGALDVMVGRRVPVGAVTLCFGLGASGALDLSRLRVEGHTQPLLQRLDAGPLGFASVRAPITPSVRYVMTFLVANRGGGWDGLAEAGVEL